MRKFDKIFLKAISYIGATSLGIFIMAATEYGVDKLLGLGFIVAAILFSCGFIGGEECIPENEREGE